MYLSKNNILEIISKYHNIHISSIELIFINENTDIILYNYLDGVFSEIVTLKELEDLILKERKDKINKIKSIIIKNRKHKK